MNSIDRFRGLYLNLIRKYNKDIYEVRGLIFYVISDGHGSYIRKDEFSGKYVPVRNYSLAEKFQQRVKASNVLNNAIGKNLRSRYEVIEIEDKSTPAAPKAKEANKPQIKDDVVKTIACEPAGESQTGKWASGIDSMTEFIMDAEKRKEEVISQLSEVDKEITDINHYIEFGRFNAYQGWLAFNMLRNRLKKRRIIKDELLVLQQLGECKITSDMMIDIKNAVAELGNRKYVPRVLTQLFD